MNSFHKKSPINIPRVLALFAVAAILSGCFGGGGPSESDIKLAFIEQLKAQRQAMAAFNKALKDAPLDSIAVKLYECTDADEGRQRCKFHVTRTAAQSGKVIQEGDVSAVLEKFGDKWAFSQVQN